MGILNDLLARVKSVNEGLQTGSMIGEAIKPYSPDVLDLQLQVHYLKLVQRSYSMILTKNL